MTDQESLALCAIRYCIGRQSYIVGSGLAWARDWGKRSPWIRNVLIQDLETAVRQIERSRGHEHPWQVLGSATDEREWRAVLAELLAQRDTAAGRGGRGDG